MTQQTPLLEFHEVAFEGRRLLLVKAPKFEKFYAKLAAGKWEPETFAFLARHLDATTSFIDVGGWIGITAAYGSSLAKRVIVIEPEPYCAAVIADAVRLNQLGNVSLLKAALANGGTHDLYMVGGPGSSVTTLVPTQDSERIAVDSVTPQQVLALAGDDPYVLKVDIEGFEFSLAEELGGFGTARLRAAQVALHPAAVAQASRWPWPASRIQASVAVYRLVRKLEQKFGTARFSAYHSLWHYIISGVIFSRKCRGTEAVFETR